MLQKLYPSCVGAPPTSAFKLIFLAEGFTVGQRSIFMSACADFYDWLLATPPFNLTRLRPNWVTILAGFIASDASGAAAAGSSATGRSVFESTYTAAGGLSVNTALVTQVVDAQRIRDDGVDRPAPELLRKGDRVFGRTGALIVLLLPDSGAAADIEHVPAPATPPPDEYHFIAVTTHAFWQQVVARALCNVLFLGDEFELANAGSTSFQAPATIADGPTCQNLEYFAQAPSKNSDSTKWKLMFGPGKAAAPAVMHAHPGSASTPDLASPANPMTQDQVEFWEGGGSFRTKVYRSAQDCLMRRKIGDAARPLRTRPVPLCPACRMHLRSELF